VIPSTKDERLWATIIHLSGLIGGLLSVTTIFVFPLPINLLLPFIIWLLKREGFPFVDDQGKEAINFHITVTIVGYLLFFTCIGAFLLPLVALYGLVLGVIASVKSNEGVAYRYPATLRLVN
jgi:uncharacterized Tic20 family protein